MTNDVTEPSASRSRPLARRFTTGVAVAAFAAAWDVDPLRRLLGQLTDAGAVGTARRARRRLSFDLSA